jgi:hypothetical protein
MLVVMYPQYETFQIKHYRAQLVMRVDGHCTHELPEVAAAYIAAGCALNKQPGQPAGKLSLMTGKTLAEMEANQRCIREAEEACRWPPSAAAEEDAAVAADAKEAEDATAADDARAENAAMEAQRRPVRSTAGQPPVRPDV